MKYNIILFIAILLSCSSDQQDLNGHWHISYKNNSSDFYATIDIENDTTAILNKDSAIYQEIGKHDQEKREIFIPGSCGAYQFKYRRVGNNLKLENYLADWIGIKCDSNCCNKLEDFTKSLRIDIDLPKINVNISNTITKSFNRYQNFENIIIGKPKDKSARGHILGSALELDGRFADFADIKIWIEHIEKKSQPLKKNPIVYRIIADKEVSTKDLKRISREFNNKMINNYYLTCLSKKPKQFITYLPFDQLDLERGNKIENLFE